MALHQRINLYAACRCRPCLRARSGPAPAPKVSAQMNEQIDSDEEANSDEKADPVETEHDDIDKSADWTCEPPDAADHDLTRSEYESDTDETMCPEW
ncbi:Uu.00g066010.m01.CDS01 [Anthostomella pinea]|uniref:Uu.00g066010.m01.CDS01 n=1 Tax=Anthostomella pinea TaxID=933095 RepID=A0AAI8VN99_9PEZI|nr:Uu.00g066010.m01.CDS01 [Anthostomella pinea]